MKLEELKNELPETPYFIHTMIQEEVEKQVRKSDIVPIQKRNRFHRCIGRVAVAAVVCFAAASTVAYAGTRLYHMYIEKKGTYSVSTGIQVSEEENSLKLPEKIHDISITSSYIPEGMEWTEEGVKLSYKDTPYQGGISISSVLMDCNNLNGAMLDTDVVESEERIFGIYDGVYLKYHDLKEDKSFNQRIYLLCPEKGRVLTLYIGDDVSKEDACQFAEGLVITENEELIDTAALSTWSNLIHSEESTGENADTNGNIPVHQIGETFALGHVSGTDKEGNYIDPDGIAVCVEEVQIADDLKLLENGPIPDEWKGALSENGKLVQNHLSYIKEGDGVESLDKVVKEENVNQKLVYATVTYTNTSEQEINHMLYLGSLMSLVKQEDGTYTVCMPEETAGDDYDYYTGDSVARRAEMGYSDVRDDNGKNYISSLKQGESIQVHMAWVVNETDLKNLYLNLNGTGAAYEPDAEVCDTGVVYIGV